MAQNLQIDSSAGANSFRDEAAVVSPQRSIKKKDSIKYNPRLGYDKGKQAQRNKGLVSLDEVFNNKHLTFEDIQKLDYKQINGNKKKDIFDPKDFIDMAGEDSDDEVLSKFRVSNNKKKQKVMLPKPISPRKNLGYLHASTEVKTNARQSYAPHVEARGRLVAQHGPYQTPEVHNTLNSAPRRNAVNKSPQIMSRDSQHGSNNKSTKSAYRSQIQIPGHIQSGQKHQHQDEYKGA